MAHTAESLNAFSEEIPDHFLMLKNGNYVESHLKQKSPPPHDDAMAKKNCKQAERYIIKAIQTSGRAAKAAGLSPGAVVTLKVDYCTHSHAQVLVGIVYAAKEEIGGILVCCVHGVITHSG